MKETLVIGKSFMTSLKWGKNFDFTKPTKIEIVGHIIAWKDERPSEYSSLKTKTIAESHKVMAEIEVQPLSIKITNCRKRK